MIPRVRPHKPSVSTFLEGYELEIIHRFCAGIDVHKAMAMVCVRRLEGKRVRSLVRQFGTMTHDILEMADWLKSNGVTHVAMESTGVLWKPIYNLLEGQFELVLCNPHHMKQIPGKKTDVKDCEWICQLTQFGLLKASFVPKRELRDIRDLTRHRAQLVDEKTRIANRIHKVLQDANVKLSSVASDVLGVSGRHMIRAIISGEKDPVVLADLARRQLRRKIPELERALLGGISEHHRFMLERLFGHLQFLEAEIDKLASRVDDEMRTSDAKSGQANGDSIPFRLAVQMADKVPGIDICTAENILAEIGTDMRQFPTAKHLASWAGICPGNHESAGKRKGGKSSKGNRWLRRAMSQAAWAASRTKNTYFAAQYRRLVGRRGKKRAIIAVAHSLLTVLYHMLATSSPYSELGPDFFDKLSPERTKRYHVRRLQSLGYHVTLEATIPA